MMIVGLAGGFDTNWRLDYDLPYDFMHDSAAVLVENGRMVAAVEQERLNRIKHTNRCAAPAVRACLEAHGAKLDDVAAFAYYATERAADSVLQAYHTRLRVGRECIGIRSLLQQRLQEEFGCPIDPARLHFVDHHLCHAYGAYAHSGFQDSLVITLDGAGEGNSSLVLRMRDGEFETLRWVSEADSLGYFYRETIRFLGYDMFEEYKVMGLAPYGDPARHREFFKMLYELGPDGSYRIHLGRIPQLHGILRPRRDDEPFSDLHKDLAASLQEALETIVFHLLKHWRQATGERRLCLSGGVAHNSTLNGKILRSGMFDEVFVHPAAHDAGGALGAALQVQRALQPQVRPSPLQHLFVGRDIGAEEFVRARLLRWSPIISVQPVGDPCKEAAQRLSEGQVLGWVQGRSEFGPRALGNRSIVADPRPAANMARINGMIKMREGYRPFAPSVLEQQASEWFELPAGAGVLPYMTCVVPVRKERREQLGAVTHVDGSARVQTVSLAQNERYYRLIEAFGRLTGVPVVLNTSFNNHAEPIVDSIDEAVACYLTTGLDALVVGSCVVERGRQDLEAYEQMSVWLPDTVVLQELDVAGGIGLRSRYAELVVQTNRGRRRRISDATRAVLLQARRDRTIGFAADAAGVSVEARAALVAELRELWSSRLIGLGPLVQGS